MARTVEPGGALRTGLMARPGAAAVAGAMFISFSGILVRLAAVSPSTAALFRCLYAVPPLALLAVWERRRFGPRAARQRVLALVAGIFFAADLIFWHRSIAYVGAGLATVLGNIQVVLVGFIAWLTLGERLSPRLLAAIPIVLAGIVLISGVLEEGAYGSNPGLGVVYGVLTALAYSGFILILRQGNRDVRRPAGPLFDATLVSAIVAAAAGWALGELDPVPGLESQLWLVLLAISAQVAGWLLISVSLPRLPAALTSILLTLQPVAAVVLSMLLIGEQPSPLQLGGVALVLAGVIVAALRKREAPEEAEPPLEPAVIEPAG
ncbi:MAG TPA: DMT family transporter [Actinomycetota bacterium]|nr:DMT family transporter [Actinomycetota bacterium]